MKSAVIIPTYNEGTRVLAVAEAAKQSPSIEEVVVVNDGSDDSATDILSELRDITVLTHRQNRGKGEALDTGMRYVRELGCRAVVFLDADLIGLSSDHIDGLLEPIESGESLMTIGYLGLRKEIVKKQILSSWGGLSGQRSLNVEIWDYLSDKDKHGFNVEAALNARLRHKRLHDNIARIALDGVGHVGKHGKDVTWPKAYWSYAKTYGAAAATYARIELENLTAIDD